MKAQMAQGKTSFLIDGFPRSIGNVNSWQEVIGDGADIMGVLFYEAREEELEQRLLKRGETSGRSDDNLETIRKRFKTYMDETMPIVEKFKKEGKVFTIDGLPPVDEVWAKTKAVVEAVES